MEEVIYHKGSRPRATDLYPILPPGRMPRVQVRIVESGAPMGGISERFARRTAGVANAVSTLTGQRVRSMLNYSFES